MARLALLTGSLALGAACQRPPAEPIDLLHALPQAERRARGNIDEAIRVDQGTLLLVSPARVTWQLRMPRPAMFMATAAMQSSAGAVVIRLGVATPRQYTDVAKLRFEAPASGPATPQAISVDLGPYSGRAWSLFYHPDQILWKLILNADALPGGTVALGNPRVEMR